MGVDTIAWPLAGLIREFDAPHAFYLFAQQLGLSADILLFDDGIAGAEQRVQFREANDLLLEAESLCVGTRLSPDPVAASLREGPAPAYELLQALEEATAVDRQLQLLVGHPWRSALQYESIAAAALVDWPHASPRTLADIFEAIAVFRELERAARDAVSTITRLATDVRKSDIDDQTAVAVAAIVKGATDLDRSLALQETSPHDLVDELLMLKEELEILLNATPAHRAQSAVDAAFRVFQLANVATFEEVTAMYRKLAKQYHPDNNPNSEEAKLRMQEINIARDTLRKHLEQMVSR